MVTIKLNLALIKSSDNKEVVLSFNGSMPLLDILDEIDLSQDEIGMVIKNSRWAPIDCIVEENDVVEIFPHLEGG